MANQQQGDGRNAAIADENRPRWQHHDESTREFGDEERYAMRERERMGP